MKTINLNIHYIDNGFCRIVYKTQIPSGAYAYFCLQSDIPNVSPKESISLYRCSIDDWNEPQSIVKPKEGVILNFEKPIGNSSIEKEVREYLS